MSEVYLYKLAAQRTEWLNVRQSLIAGNVSNANTPGFQAQDLQPFSSVLDHTSITMASDNPGHIMPTELDLNPAKPEDEDSANATLSGQFGQSRKRDDQARRRQSRLLHDQRDQEDIPPDDDVRSEVIG